MRIIGSRDEAVLHALGASSCAEARDESGALIGYDVEPDIDLSGYEAKLAELKASPPTLPEHPLSQEELIAVRKLIRASSTI